MASLPNAALTALGSMRFLAVEIMKFSRYQAFGDELTILDIVDKGLKGRKLNQSCIKHLRLK